jgi:hypothetical protein
MKKFLFKLSVALMLALALHIVAGFFAGGKTDEYYLRFTGHQQNSLVIGSSRAAQAMVPSVFEQYKDQLNYEGPMYNFAFTALSSPYGELYLQKIKEKLNPSVSNGLFILAVEPYSIAIQKTEDKNFKLPETKNVLSKTQDVNCTPNYEYLIRNYNKGWGHLFLEHLGLTTNEMVLQPDGWLEVIVPMDSVSIAKRTKGKVKNHQGSIGEYELSPMRVEYLEKTISFLQKHGKVYVVRLPISKAIYDIEKQILPEFDQVIQGVVSKMNVPYNDLNGASALFQYKDGHHIGHESAFDCSDSVARWVMELKMER